MLGGLVERLVQDGSVVAVGVDVERGMLQLLRGLLVGLSALMGS